jgi:uncharacterized repeat protein (TIGR02543 family)
MSLESSYVIALNSDISLSESLVIPANKNITLTSTGDDFFKLIGTPTNKPTIIVEDRGFLIIDGIAVTRITDPVGLGVAINSGGTLVMLDGEISENQGGVLNDRGSFSLFGGVISNNTDIQFGGGVYNNYGSFLMFGGAIYGNEAYSGGGVYNWEGTFDMFGGAIYGNTATQYHGGGVVNHDGVFRLHKGVISNNTATQYGGGVQNSGFFEMLLDGTISNNIAEGGGGVANFNTFSLLDGVIANNSAHIWGGGVLNMHQGNFSLSGGRIYSNTATTGGGVGNSGIFKMSDGIISNNAAPEGGGVTNYETGSFRLLDDGTIDSNTANVGGGVLNMGDFSLSGGIISNNTALNGGGVSLFFGADAFTMEGGIIANNTAVERGGGISIAFGDLDKLFVSDTMVFKNNRAAAAYNRDPAHDGLYQTNIGSKVVWSEPFVQGYNNYDISYTRGTLVYVVSVRDSYALTTGTGSYPAGTIITVNAGTREGYTFSGWTVNEGGITLPNSATATFTMPTNNVVVTASWNPTSSGGGGSSGGSGDSSSNKPSPNPSTPNNPVQKPTPDEPDGNDNVVPTPEEDKEKPAVWPSWSIVLALVIVLIAAIVVVGVIVKKRLKTA